MDRTLERLTEAGHTFADWFNSPETRKTLLLHLNSSARILTATLAVIYLGLACSTFFIQSQPDHWILADNPNFYIDTATGRVKDRVGRERIFHGVNVVFKDQPWLPQTDTFHPQLSFSDDDVEILKKLGLNVIRLGVMWPGVHPEKPGTANHTYLGEIRKLVQKLHLAGIYTLVDFHQDVFGSRFCGEGVPDWLVDNAPFSTNTQIGASPSQLQAHAQQTQPRSDNRDPAPEAAGALRGQNRWNSTGHQQGLQDVPCVGYAVCMTPEEYAESFPEPLLPRFGIGHKNDPTNSGDVTPEVIPGGGKAELLAQLEQKLQAKASLRLRSSPSVAQCDSIDWGIYHLTFAVSRAFQDLYENRWGWRDRLAEYWRDVAAALKGEEGVLGYDLINEPWAGDVFFNPLLFAPGVADRLNFAPMYEHLQAAIRKVDPNRLLFFEGLTFDDLASGFTQVPGGQVYANMSVMSYHYYRPPNVAPKATFKQKDLESRRLQCGWMLTEFGIPNRRPDWLTSAAGRGDGKLMQVDGKLKPGVACLPVTDRTDGAPSRNCSTRRNTCAGAFAGSWKEFVQAWSQSTVSNKSPRAEDSLSAKLPPCDGKRMTAKSETEQGTVRESSSLISQVKETDALSKDEGRHGRVLQVLPAGSQDSVIRPQVAEPRRSTRGPLPKALQKLSLSFQPPLSSPKDQEAELSLQPDRSAVPLGDREVWPGSWNEMAETLTLADDHLQSWMAWEYKPFVPITGANYGLFQPDGTLHPIVQQLFWRTYPLAVAGSVEAFSFDPYASAFNMSYVAGKADVKQERRSWSERLHSAWASVGSGFTALVSHREDFSRRHVVAEDQTALARTTEVFVCCNRAMRVYVEPAGIEQEWNADRNILRLRHSAEHSGARVVVQIAPAEE